MGAHKKTLVQSWLPPALYYFLLQFSNNIKFQFSNRQLLKSNAALKGLGSSKRAFVLATGPSLKQEDLSVLKGEDCFSVSNFFLHQDLNTIAPKFHFFAPFHPPLILDNFISWMREADIKLPAETQIILGATDEPLVRQYNLFKNRKVHYLYLAYHVKVGKINLEQPILWPQSGPLMILPVLLAMGYEKIYLLGCDHTVLRDFNNVIPHFYDKEKDSRKNASDAGAWADIIQAHQYSMNTFIQYDKYLDSMKKYYPKAQIISLSKDSWLNGMLKNESLSSIKS